MSNDTASIEVTLPSRGAEGIYGDTFPGGKVRIRKWLMRELRILESSGMSMHDRVRKIIDTCVILPPGLNPNDLLMSDRFAALLLQRTYSFGTAVYHYDYKCPDCGHQNRKVACDIVEDFNENDLDPSLVEPFDVELPDAKITVSLRFLRGSDESAILKRSKLLSMKSQDADDPSSMVRVARSIVKIDGVDSIEADTEARVNTFSARDIATIRIAIDKVEPGIDTTVRPLCKKCGSEAELEMPMVLEFFRPTVL